jgi:hypothetical protein
LAGITAPAQVCVPAATPVARFETVVGRHRCVASGPVDLEFSFLVFPPILVLRVNRVTEVFLAVKPWRGNAALELTGTPLQVQRISLGHAWTQCVKPEFQPCVARTTGPIGLRPVPKGPNGSLRGDEGTCDCDILAAIPIVRVPYQRRFHVDGGAPSYFSTRCAYGGRNAA